MLARRKKTPMGVRTSTGPMRCEAHKKYVRTKLRCSVPGCQHSGDRIEAAHVDYFYAKLSSFDIPIEDRGYGSVKTADRWIFPLCSTHHAETHKIGCKTFAAKYGIDPHEIAYTAWRWSPARPKWEAKNEAANGI